MHNLRIALLLLGASPLAAAAEVWRWVDQDGVVHLSDKPVPGAQRIQVKPPVSTAREPPPVAVPSASRSTASRAPARSTVPYSRCEVVDPADDAAFDAPESVQLSAQVLPVLRPGDRVVATLNDAPISDWPAGALVHVLQQPARGTYVVSFRVVSADGRTQCQSAARSFHVRQPSIIRPGLKR